MRCVVCFSSSLACAVRSFLHKRTRSGEFAWNTDFTSSLLSDHLMGSEIQAHLGTVNLRIAELERAVGTFSVKGRSTGGGGKSDPADVEQRLVGLFKEKWARAAAER